MILIWLVLVGCKRNAYTQKASQRVRLRGCCCVSQGLISDWVCPAFDAVQDTVGDLILMRSTICGDVALVECSLHAASGISIWYPALCAWVAVGVDLYFAVVAVDKLGVCFHSLYICVLVICICTGCEPSQCGAALLMVSHPHVIKRTNRWHSLPSAAPRVSPAGWWLLDCQRTCATYKTVLH